MLLSSIYIRLRKSCQTCVDRFCSEWMCAIGMGCILLTAFFLDPMCSFAVLKEETFTIKFDKKIFYSKRDSLGVRVYARNLTSCYIEEGMALPSIGVSYAVDGKFSYKKHRDVAYENYFSRGPVAALPQLESYIECGEKSIVASIDSVNHKWLLGRSRFMSVTEYGDLSILHFVVSPFRYDAMSNVILYADSITITVSLEMGDTLFSNVQKSALVANKPQKGFIPEFVEDMVENPQKVQDVLTRMIVSDIPKRIDYVIITRDSLKAAFEPLIQWKRTKGIYAEVRTIEEIESSTVGKDLQEKIKYSLYTLYNNHGLKYAMLGGDDDIVPKRGCYGQIVINDYTSDIPADIYYSCFKGQFDWDANRNGVYGEVEDGANLSQSIYLTRLPIRTRRDIANYIAKVISYETAPKYSGKMLMGGKNCAQNGDLCAETDDYYPGRPISGTEAQGNRLYEEYIRPVWGGVRDKMYDTYTDFGGEKEHRFTRTRLMDALSSGYSFVHILTHGRQNRWAMQKEDFLDRDEFFYSEHAMNLKNSSHTILSTIACMVNAFDWSYDIGSFDPCLTEGFIRGADNGVIAILANSREGWGEHTKSEFGISMQYEALFYQKMFDKNCSNRSFGAIVAAAKAARSFYAKGMYSLDTWVQYSLNPVGDPETNIFVSQPETFKSVCITLENDSLMIQTGVEGCRICVMSKADYGESFYDVTNNCNKRKISCPAMSCTICITHPDYIPIIYELNEQYIQNETIDTNRNYISDKIRVGSHVSSKTPFGDV